MSGASFARGSSKQDFSTPPELLAWFRATHGAIAADLAASAHNAAADLYYDAATDSLAQDWTVLVGALAPREWLWLNPPYDRIAPWAAKCAGSVSRSLGGAGDRGIALLVPASVGAIWWASHVHDLADVVFLRPRVSFDGIGPYPKDLALCLYTANIDTSYTCASWKDHEI